MCFTCVQAWVMENLSVDIVVTHSTRDAIYWFGSSVNSCLSRQLMMTDERISTTEIMNVSVKTCGVKFWFRRESISRPKTRWRNEISAIGVKLWKSSRLRDGRWRWLNFVVCSGWQKKSWMSLSRYHWGDNSLIIVDLCSDNNILISVDRILLIFFLKIAGNDLHERNLSLISRRSNWRLCKSFMNNCFVFRRDVCCFHVDIDNQILYIYNIRLVVVRKVHEEENCDKIVAEVALHLFLERCSRLWRRKWMKLMQGVRRFHKMKMKMKLVEKRWRWEDLVSHSSLLERNARVTIMRETNS